MDEAARARGRWGGRGARGCRAREAWRESGDNERGSRGAELRMQAGTQAGRDGGGACVPACERGEAEAEAGAGAGGRGRGADGHGHGG